MTISVGIIEDEPEVVRSLTGILCGTAEIRVAGHASNRREVMQLLKKNICDVYLVDIGLPDIDGVDLIEDIRNNLKTSKTIVVTSYLDAKLIFKCFKLGASGYILKQDNLNDLSQKVIQAYNGAIPVSSDVSRFLVNRVNELDHEKLDNSSLDVFVKRFNVSRSELRVLQLLIDGLSINSIADRLHNSPHTISQHLRSIYRKLNVSSRAMAVKIAMEHGFHGKKIP